MKCHVCGFENTEGNAFCENCGAVLRERNRSDAESSGESWGFFKEDREDGYGADDGSELRPDPAGMPKADPMGGDHDLDTDDIDELEQRFTAGVDEWEDTTPAVRRDRERKAREHGATKPAGRVFDEADALAARTGAPAENESGKNRPKREPQKTNAADRRRSRDEYETDEQTARPVRRETDGGAPRQSSGNGKKKSSVPGIIAIICIVAAIAAIVAVIISVLKDGINPNKDPQKNAEITINPNDPNTYLITIFAKEGSQILFEKSSGEQSGPYTVSHKNGVALKVAASDLLPVEPIEGEKCDVSPKVYLVAADGTKTPIEMPSVSIDVPQLDIRFNNPDTFVAENGTVELSGSIQKLQRAAELTLNGQKLAVADDGTFSYSERMEKGEYELKFVGSLGGHTIFRKSFNVTVNRALTPEEVVIIDRSFVTRALNVEDFIRVEGKVKPGTTLDVHSDDPDFSIRSQPEIDEAGNFSFVVNLPVESKNYPFVITATTPDGSVFNREFSVQRPPKYNDYVPTVWPDNYEEMIKPNHLTDMRGFELKGTIDEILRDDDFLEAKMTLDNGHQIIIEYHNHYSQATTLEPGAHQTLYGYVTGLDSDNVLHLFIWFVKG